MPRVSYMIPMQGFRPRTNAEAALRSLRGLRGLGDSNTFSGCVQGYDANSNPVDCNDATAVVWMDANGNAVAAGTAAVPAAPAPGAGGAPTGSLLRYQGTWQVTTTLNVNTIISRVNALLGQYGLQMVSSSNSGGALTVGNFNVQLLLQVTGSGFAQPSDAGSIVDHAYYSTTGRMPVSSATVLQSSGASVPTLPGIPSTSTASSASASSGQSSFTSWLEQNAIWLLLAAVALPAVIKKL